MLKNPHSTRIVPPDWQFQSERKWSPVSPSEQAQDTAAKNEKKASDDLLHAIVDACVSNVAVLDESGAMVYANKAWQILQQGAIPEGDCFATARDYFESFRRFTGLEPDNGEETTLDNDIQEILDGEQTEFHRKYYCTSLMEQHPFLMHAARLNLPDSSFRILITRENATSARDDLKHNEERLRQLLNTTKIVAWEAENGGQRFTHVTEQASKMLGYPESAWYEPGFLAAHIHPDDRQRVLAAFRRQPRITKHFDLIFRMLGNDGRLVWVQNLISVAGDKSGCTHGFMIDISESKRAEAALRSLGSRLIAAQEEERKRLARELHDDLSQRMAVLSIELDQMGQGLNRSLGLRKRFEQLQLQTQEIANDIHRLSYKLHPSKLDHVGLAAAIKSLCEELIVQSGKPRIHFHQSGFPADLPKDITLCIFRIAQEALRNCVKYSRAESAQVVLTKTSQAIHLSVSDNGCGFDMTSGVMEKGLGFISMKERLRLVCGQINICSHPQRGTRIDVSVPLNRDHSNTKT